MWFLTATYPVLARANVRIGDIHVIERVPFKECGVLPIRADLDKETSCDVLEMGLILAVVEDSLVRKGGVTGHQGAFAVIDQVELVKVLRKSLIVDLIIGGKRLHGCVRVVDNTRVRLRVCGIALVAFELHDA